MEIQGQHRIFNTQAKRAALYFKDLRQHHQSGLTFESYLVAQMNALKKNPENKMSVVDNGNITILLGCFDIVNSNIPAVSFTYEKLFFTFENPSESGNGQRTCRKSLRINSGKIR